LAQTVEFKQTGDLHPALADPATRTLNAGKLTGRWLNTDPTTQGVAEITIIQEGDHFSVRIMGVGADGPVNWPTARARVMANLEEEAGQRAVALAANFEFGFMRVESYLRVNKGVLVIVAYHTFLDASHRSNYVNREFFYRAED
jgi:erythromycin esterase-like protein